MIHKVMDIIDEQPTFAIPLQAILAELKLGGALQTLTPVEYITNQQRRWYKGICLPELAKWQGETEEWWDSYLKALCHGPALLKDQVVYVDFSGQPVRIVRYTTKGVGVKKMTAFIENILSECIKKDWRLMPPDKELRR